MNYLHFLLLSIFNFTSQSTETIELTITLTNIKTIKGNIELGLFNDPKTFLDKGKEYKTYSKKVTNETVIFTLNNLTKGDYAISLYHDVNSDKECNLNFFRIPVEPYGFSQNYVPKLFKPSFDDCKITAQKNMAITIELID